MGIRAVVVRQWIGRVLKASALTAPADPESLEMPQTLSGACLCGRVQYEIEGEPRFMYQCFCGKCRAAAGASFVTNIIADAARFKITAGRQSLSAYESSPQKFRHFCAHCGSPIYSHGEKPSTSLRSAAAH